MRIKAIVCGVCLIGSTAFGQVGTWQSTFKNIGGEKQIGFGYMTFNSDGSMTGYNMTSLLLGVGVQTGTWSVADNVITVSFTEGVSGTSETGTIVAKLSSTSMRGTAIFQDGSKFSVRSVPGTPIAVESATFEGAVKTGRVVEGETFSNSPDPDFPGIADSVGMVSGESGHGQAIAEPNGTIIGYGIVSLSGGGTLGTAFSGKYNARSGRLTTKGIDQDGDKVIGFFLRE